jgi:2-polyprenyl-6-methoxyphenol hydroxylase-like FAD-dependent oxidoreductase
MTLSSLPRYDGDRVSHVGEHAVVVGASVAGLLTARVLADGFETVTVLDRDPLRDGPTTRRGVPQGEHIHVLLEAGRATIEDLLPGYGEALLSAGALVVDASTEFIHYEKGGYLADGPTRMPMYSGTRPLLEHHLRRRVAERDGVDLRAGCQCTDYLLDDANEVAGVAFRESETGGGELLADLVVDATGRTSSTPSWLAEHGYESPAVDEVHVDVAYSTVDVDRPADDRRTFLVPPDPPRTRGVGMFPVEDGRWVATAFGVHGDHPPADFDGVREFVASLPAPEPGGLLERRPRRSDDVAQYPFPSNRRHRYEALGRFPNGLVVVGDAICSFNPINGQGMSVAALEALALHHALAAGGRRGLGLRFFDRVEDVVDAAWSITVGGDFAFPQTDGPEPTGTDLLNRYLDRLVRKAHADGELRAELYGVFNMERPPSALIRPGVAWRVLKPGGAASGTTGRATPTGSP